MSAPELGSIRRVAVFRALMLGDLLCAVPALRALRAALPRAEITLIGLPWAQALAERLTQVDRFAAFTGHPGLPERDCDRAALPGFIAGMRRRAFDLLIQMHGDGRVTNPLLARFGALRLAGFYRHDAAQARPAWGCVWPDSGHEIERLLALTDSLGIARRGRHLEFPLRDADRTALARLSPALHAQPYACIHAGAQLASRRWPAPRFAAVADALARRGLLPVLTGSAGEAALVRNVATQMRERALDLCGRTSLWTLGALVERARLVVCNDTGVSHVAAALGTPSVVVSSGAEAPRWAPLDRRRHAMLWQDLPCRPCAFRECPTGHGCALAVSVESVLERADAQLSDARVAA